MKKLVLLFTLPLFLFACGGEEPKEKELENIDVEKNPLGALMKMGKNMAENAEKMEEKMKNKKDAKAIHYEELLKYLPETIEGYQVNGEPKGASMDMQGMSYSSAEIKFKNENGNKIDIVLLDYNAAYNMYTMATTMWASGFKIDTSEEFAQSISFGDHINGWESYKKKSNKASIALGIGDRFLLTIEGDNQDGTQTLKDIAKSMDIDALADLE